MKYGCHTTGIGYHTRWRDAFDYVASQRQPGEGVACPHPMIGKYYLADGGVERSPKGPDELRAVARPMWTVFEAEDAVRGRVRRWLDDVAEWKASFDAKVVQPYSSVRVYYFDPDGDRSTTE